MKEALIVNNLTKVYKQQDKTGLSAASFKSRPKEAAAQEVEALKDLSFKVGHGEVVGIIGKNGAGKSTLLSILSGTTKPNSGEVLINGTTASILSIGTGFHPDLSGRENVYLSGQLLGMKKRDIDERFDEIVEFSEIAYAINKPVKQYSNGMYLRLAFSVIAHLDTDILLLDEVLNVGDARFKEKSSMLIKKLIEKGKTFVIVTHDSFALKDIADRLILIDKGKIQADGPYDEVLKKYHQAEYLTKQETTDSGYMPITTDLQWANIEKIGFVDRPTDRPIYTTEETVVEMQIRKKVSGIGMQVVCIIKSIDNIRLVMDSHAFREHDTTQSLDAGTYKVRFTIPANFLYKGVYGIDIILCQTDKPETLLNMSNLLSFQVRQQAWQEQSTWGKMGTYLRPNLEWQLDKID